MRAAQQHGADLIVNACDGELGATKDAWVVSHHLAEVVEGAGLVTAERGRIRPVIDQRFALSEAPAALRALASGTRIGKIIVTP